jgi:hypothetical protein
MLALQLSQQAQTGLVLLLVLYIVFAQRQAPQCLRSLLSMDAGRVIWLVAVAAATVYISPVIGLLLGLAYLVTLENVLFVLDSNSLQQKPLNPDGPVLPAATANAAATVEGFANPVAAAAAAAHLQEGDGGPAPFIPAGVALPPRILAPEVDTRGYNRISLSGPSPVPGAEPHGRTIEGHTGEVLHAPLPGERR